MTARILPLATLPLLALSLASASGCGPTPQPVGGGTGGVVNTPSGGAPSASGGSSSGGTSTSSGGSASNSTGGVANSSGGSVNASTGGSDSATGGSDSSSGGSQNGGGDEVEASTGCGQAAPAGGSATIDVGGTMREYILAVPENYDPATPYKLIFAWHPWGGSAQQVAGNGPSGYYGLLGASEGQAILVSPEGLPFGGDSLGWGNENGQDIAFLEAMMERFDSELCFDHNRVFSTGFSFGGMMSNAVACSGLARAVAPMAGNSMVAGCADGSTPVAYMGFHGVDDSVVDLEGGQAARDVFIERNGCGAAQPSDSNWCELAGGNYSPCECTTYEGCTEGYPVTWCEFKGDHMVAPSSAQTIWDFFAQF
jgi:polyhydroxybutyrate depolymerase